MSPGRGLAWAGALLAPAALAPAWVRVAPRLAGPHWLASACGLILLLLIGTCAATDLARSKIPNWATYPALLWGLGLNGWASASADWSEAGGWAWPLGAVGLGACLAGAGLGFVVLFFLYRLSGGGAGDVKLAAAIGGLVGPDRMIDVLIASYLAAGAVVASWAIWSIGPLTLLTGLGRRVGSLLLPGAVAGPTPEQRALLRSPIRLAPFFAIGALAEATGWISWRS